MMKYAILIVMVVLGNALLACAQHYVRVERCSEQFVRDTTRPHINVRYYSNGGGLACYQNLPGPWRRPRPLDDNIRFSNTSRWADICGHWERAVKCMNSWILEKDAVAMLEERTLLFTNNLVYEDYEIDRHGSLAASIYHFPRRVCHNYQVKSELTKYLSTDLSCLKRSDHVEFYRCYETLDCELRHIQFEWNDANLRLIRIIERLSAGALKCMRNVIENTACETEAKELLTFISELQMPSIIDTGNLNITAPHVNFGSDRRCTVGVYGDPHLLYCDADQLVTCSSPGEQVYLSNSYMDIRGTNVELLYRTTPKPTVIHKIVITFKSADGKSHVTTYTADNGTLPGTFENGKTTIGQGYDQVSIAAISDYRVTFIQSSMGAILALRRWRNNYFFTLRMSNSVANASHGLLGTGCPPSQIINRNANQPRFRRAVAAVTQTDCDSACESMVNETMMMATCKYDCFVTKDLAFVNMSADAVADLTKVKDRDLGLIESARIYEESMNPTTTPASAASSIRVFWALTFVQLFLTQILLTK